MGSTYNAKHRLCPKEAIRNLDFIKMNQIPAKKRSIFSKQAFTKVNVAKDPVDFFSCAKKVYPQLLEEEERKRQSKIKRKDREQSRECDDPKNNVFDEDNTITTPPKGFVDDIYNKGNSHSSFLSLHEESNRPGSLSDHEEKDPLCLYDVQSLQNLSAKKQKFSSHDEMPSKSIIDLEEAPSKPIISLESDEEEISQSTLDPFQNDISSPSLLQSSFAEHQSDKTDEEYPEFIQQAREREKLKVRRHLFAASRSEHSDRSPEDNIIDVFDSEPKPAIEDDPTVELLITSELEGTRPLRVKRKLSQRLKEARLTWCEKQHIRTDKLGRPLEEVIFFTWRGKRLFDVTTCGSLGLKVDKDRIISQGKDGFGPNGNIHLEAWTEDTLRVKEEKDSENRRLGNDNQNDSKPDKDDDPTCKLILKAKDMEPCKIVVRPTTTIRKMIEAFRKAKALPESTKISLHFDGDLLDPNSTIEDTELGDVENVDTVEVYLKI